MIPKTVISRRTFLSFSAIGTLGSLTQDLTPTPSPTPTPEPPDKPRKPSLLADDVLARGTDFLAVFWQKVDTAESYELKVVSSLGSATHAYTIETATVSGLSPNLTYDIAVRALNTSGASAWSDSLMTCTRPPVPTSPQLAFAQMIEMPHEIKLQWNLTQLVSAVNDGPNLKVTLGVRTDTGDITPVMTNLALVDQVMRPNQQIGRSFFLRLTGANPAAPGGINLSQWSTPTVLAPMVFGELRVPSVSESRVLSVNILRGYYANS